MASRLAALVTGGATGIGRSAVLALARAGYDIALNYSSSEKAARETAAEAEKLGAQTLLCKCDVSDDPAVRKMLREVEVKFGRLDVLVNNAGISGPTVPVEEISPADWDRTIAVDLNGQFYCARLAVPLLRPPVAARSCSFLRARPVSGIHSGRRTRHASGRSSAS
jgi:3-oxoacyl-[acyl-carrier protein] reductase